MVDVGVLIFDWDLCFMYRLGDWSYDSARFDLGMTLVAEFLAFDADEDAEELDDTDNGDGDDDTDESDIGV